MKLETGNWKLGARGRDAAAFAPAPPPCSRSLPNFRTPELPNFRTPKRPRAGFTLLELLLVMVIIAILGTIIMGSATYITRLARVKRAEVACVVLETALTRYRSDYNTWPDGGIKAMRNAKTGDMEVIAAGKDNAKIFGMLREDSSTDNPRRIRYLDESTVFTVDKNGKSVMLARAGTGDKPLIYVTREGGVVKYFKVVINVDNDTAEVTAPELKD